MRKDGSEYSVDKSSIPAITEAASSVNATGKHLSIRRVDAAVIQIMHGIFVKWQGAPDEDRLKAMIKRQTIGCQAKQRKLSLELQKSKAAA